MSSKTLRVPFARAFSIASTPREIGYTSVSIPFSSCLIAGCCSASRAGGNGPHLRASQMHLTTHVCAICIAASLLIFQSPADEAAVTFRGKSVRQLYIAWLYPTEGVLQFTVPLEHWKSRYVVCPKIREKHCALAWSRAVASH